MKESNYMIPFFVILAISVVLAVFLIVNVSSSDIACGDCETCEVCQEIPVEKALMTAKMTSWAENLYDSSESIYQVGVYNYGYVEAKNIEIVCEVFDSDEDGVVISEIPIGTFTKKIGNMASTSYDYNEIIAKDTSAMDQYSTASCRVSSCDNCEILDDRIPEEDVY